LLLSSSFCGWLELQVQVVQQVEYEVLRVVYVVELPPELPHGQRVLPLVQPPEWHVEE
jgi:hypothetical protein